MVADLDQRTAPLDTGDAWPDQGKDQADGKAFLQLVPPNRRIHDKMRRDDG